MKCLNCGHLKVDHAYYKNQCLKERWDEKQGTSIRFCKCKQFRGKRK